MTKTLYDSLGVDKKATADEIKEAYKKQAKQHHPDKGGDNEKMTEITRAYSVLGDKKKRDRYDETGEEQLEPFDKKFQEFIQRFLIQIIESKDVERVDLIEELRKIARQNIHGTKMAKAESVDKRKKYEKVLKRLEAKKENRISVILTMNVDEMKKAEGLFDEHLEFMGEVMECLDSYHYNFEEQQEEGYFIYTQR
jgi:DnaJ-class molecular chaperone